MSEKVEGTVKWFNEAKGFGFIVKTMADKTYSLTTALSKVTVSNSSRRPKVSFILGDGKKGPQAEQIEAI